MQAAILQRLGEVPAYADVPDPEPTGEQVVARVRAVAVKNIEKMLASGQHYGSGRLALPGTLGVDAVLELPDGRRVYAGAVPPAGTMAELALVDPRMTIEVPDGVDDAAAAALPNAGASAWFALEYAGRLQPGHSVLVLGGTGVTGGLAVQLAKHRYEAAYVAVAGRNRGRLDRLTELGADHAITIGNGDITEDVARLHAEHPFDVVIDYLWGAPAEQTLAALGNDDLGAAFRHTRYVQVGEMAGATIALPAAVLRSAGVELVGQGGGSIPKDAFARIGSEIVPVLFDLLSTGALSVETVTRPLAEVAEAWSAPTPSGTRLVLVP